MTRHLAALRDDASPRAATLPGGERGLRVIVLGLGLSSPWGNGHDRTFSALVEAFAARGHEILFLERGPPRYAISRDLIEAPGCDLIFYESIEALARFHDAIVAADVVIISSCVPEGIRAGAYVHAHAGGITAFYDIDSAVTLAALENGDCAHLAAEQIPSYELYLSLTGGPALDTIERRYGSPAARALYGSIDPDCYAPREPQRRYDLGYIGTYSADRQPLLETLLLEPARRLPAARFIVAGQQYPESVAFPANVARVDHLPPAMHAAFYADCRFALNVAHGAVTRLGHSPNARLLEAAACGTPVISDAWEGLDRFLTPGEEILLADSSAQVVSLLTRVDETRRRAIAAAARTRILAEHTADHRAEELETLLLAARAHVPPARP